ncbi:Uu.00g047630.m01.CDS01 [Anthostomella pinea]|uniref:Uu.00g047630.m01.CDS01 n=1 Tax=Anthostomella pinea TaxID=933095 RepID=A0AAI8VCI7_9PEZI|nr:Uu.00g047630.m01.CDS01 [Anthostomella pinea]
MSWYDTHCAHELNKNQAQARNFVDGLLRYYEYIILAPYKEGPNAVRRLSALASYPSGSKSMLLLYSMEPEATYRLDIRDPAHDKVIDSAVGAAINAAAEDFNKWKQLGKAMVAVKFVTKEERYGLEYWCPVNCKIKIDGESKVKPEHDSSEFP